MVPHNFSSPALSERALPHYLKTIRMLRERLEAGGEESLSFTTAAVILALAGHAYMALDIPSARNHVEGVRRLVGLRGGLASYSRKNAKLPIEILRIDLGITLTTGSKPVFFSGGPFGEPFLPYPNLTLLLRPVPGETGSRNATTLFLDGLDDDLGQAWRVMSEFCAVINLAASSKQLISTTNFLDAMASVMYRLLHMGFANGSTNEAVRLTLLAFSSMAFLHYDRFGIPYTHFASSLRDCLSRLEPSAVSPQLLLWLLTIGALSVFDINAAADRWVGTLLLSSMDLCEVRSWNQMRRQLVAFLWIDILHDHPGMAIFDSLSKA